MGIALYPLNQYEEISEFKEGEDEHEENSRIISRIKEIKDDLQTQGEYLCRGIRSLTEEVAAFEREAKRLEEAAKYRRNRVERLKEFIKWRMELAGIDKLRAGLFALSLQASPPSVEILDESQIPEGYRRVVISIDKRGIIEKLRAGGEVPGAELKRSTYLRIR